MDEKRIDELVDKLTRFQKAYYVDGMPMVSDSEYDALFDELSRLEAENPSLIRPDSPTQRVGSDLSSDFPEVRHTIPVLSLDKAYSVNEVLSWMSKSEEKEGGRLSFVEEEKIDGVSMVLYYEDGLLTRGVTRGNGAVGNDVTPNIKTIKDIPLRLNESVTLAVRGEVYLEKEDFEHLKDENTQFANPRNLASGTIRRIKSNEAAAVPLKMFVYEGFWQNKEETPSDHIAILSSLKKLGLRINPHIALFAHSRESAARRLKEASLEGEALSFDELGAYIEEKTAGRRDLPYEIDGLVTKVNELEVRERMGYTEHHPRWAIAYKFESPQAVTVINGVTVQVGRTGRITPVAELAPVFLGGSTVKRATLHNQEYIDSLEIAIGDSVSVVKRGDVIPAVEEVIEKNEEGNTVYKIPLTCPTCGSALVSRGAHLFCPNKNCRDQVLGRITFFTARDQMDMENLGPKAIEMLVEEKLISDVPDLYTCDFDKLTGLKGVGAKTIESYKKAVKDSLSRPFSTVLRSLGLPEIGKKGADLLVAGGFDTMDKLLKTAEEGKTEDLTRVDQIGERTAELLIAALNDEEMRDRIERLRAAGLQFEEKEEKEEELPQIFSGQVWCVTGSFEHYNPRSLALREIEKRGGRTVSSVTGKTTHLLCGKGGGGKRAEAERVGSKLVSEEEFLAMLGLAEKTEEEQLSLF